MSGDAQPTPISRPARTMSPERAQQGILSRLQKAGAKGASSLWSPGTAASTREVLESALAALESSGAVIADRRKARPRFFDAEFAPALPSVEGACEKLLQFSARLHPALLAGSELKRALAKDERSYFLEALTCLKDRRQLLELQRKDEVLYGDSESIRAMLGARAETVTADGEAAPLSPKAIRAAYDALVQRSGFPSVEIAALQGQADVALEPLQAWLIEAHATGRAVFNFGDWSLADEPTRAAAISLQGERYLLVQLLD